MIREITEWSTTFDLKLITNRDIFGAGLLPKKWSQNITSALLYHDTIILTFVICNL